jgi:hypothetical protein
MSVHFSRIQDSENLVGADSLAKKDDDGWGRVAHGVVVHFPQDRLLPMTHCDRAS